MAVKKDANKAIWGNGVLPANTSRQVMSKLASGLADYVGLGDEVDQLTKFLAGADYTTPAEAKAALERAYLKFIENRPNTDELREKLSLFLSKSNDKIASMVDPRQYSSKVAAGVARKQRQIKDKISETQAKMERAITAKERDIENTVSKVNSLVSQGEALANARGVNAAAQLEDVMGQLNKYSEEKK